MEYIDQSIISNNFNESSLKLIICSICADKGFSSIQNSSIYIFIQIIQQFYETIALYSKSFCELSSRVNPTIYDIYLAFLQLGVDVEGLITFFKVSRTSKLQLNINSSMNEIRCLQIGQHKQLPSYIPLTFPHYPDQYTFKRTQVLKHASNCYQLLREKSATQRHDVQIALTRYIAKIGDTENLFPDDPYAFPLISMKANSLSYIEALLCTIAGDIDLTDTYSPNSQSLILQPTLLQSSRELININKFEDKDKNVIDNPFLRPIKMPKLKHTNF